MSKRVSFGSTMDKELMDKLKKLSEQTKVPISKLLDSAVESLFIYIEQNKKPRGSQQTQQKQSNLRVAEINNEPYRIGINLPTEEN